MIAKTKAATEVATLNPTANLHNPKDMAKILEYFRYNIGSTLDAMIATGILRNSITWYVSYLEKAGLLKCLYKAPDRRTRMMAKHYSSDPRQWERFVKVEPTLFDDFFKHDGAYAV